MSLSPSDALAASPLFREVPAPIRHTMIERGVLRSLAPGERLLTIGQPNASLFVVITGAVEVHLPGHDEPLLRLGPGECVGELSLIDGQPASADVAAVLDTTVLELSCDHVWSVIDDNAAFARNLLRILAGRVRDDDQALTVSIDRRRHYERLSMQDGLTGISNRRWFDAVFETQVDRLLREERSAALLMIDVDDFKAVNDAHGHAAGDAMLRRIASVLTDGVRPEDLLARYGGEEFAVLVADAEPTEAFEVAERLRQTVERATRPEPLPCTISVGVALAHAGEPFTHLVQRADAALFRAKQAGRNRVSG